MSHREPRVVLVVEDEPDVAEFIRVALTDQGHDVVVVSDGAAVGESLAQRRPDLVTLDISLPEKSGVRVYRELKARPEWQHIKVVMVTGVRKDFEGFISSRRQVPPPDGYVRKPFTAQELVEVVNRALGSEPEGGRCGGR